MRVIAPRPRTAAIGAGGGITTRLPDEVVAEQGRRLRVFTAVGGCVWAFSLLMDGVVLPRTVGATVPSTMLGIEAVAALTSLALFLVVRARNAVPQAGGVLFMLLNVAGVALINTWVSAPTRDSLGHLSWTTFIILASAAIMPGAPRRLLMASMLAASLEPIGVWCAHLRGLAVPGLVETLALAMPNYVSAIVATVPSQIFQGMGRRLREAQALGSYQLMELLGRGGMGEVWRARHQWLARHAAIKLVRPEALGAAAGAESSLVLRRFEREAQATASLNSPHSIRLFDFGVTEEGSFYYVMELLTGRNLESLVRDFGPLPAARVVYLLRQVCHSLAEAHARGLVHRDIKPANIYVCRMALDFDFVKVLDFGLVKLRRGDAAETMLTANFTTAGTPAYMAPETILGAGDVDGRADLYSVGCVAYYLLTGELVFPSRTPMEMLVDHVHTAPLPPSARTELSIPPALEALVLACLEKSPARRPQNAEELLDRLEGCGTPGDWTGTMAQRWWKTHLPELSGPLPSVDASAPVTAGINAGDGERRGQVVDATRDAVG